MGQNLITLAVNDAKLAAIDAALTRVERDLIALDALRSRSHHLQRLTGRTQTPESPWTATSCASRGRTPRCRSAWA